MTQQHIVFIDNSYDAHTLFDIILRSLLLDVTHAWTCDEAVDAIVARRPDLIVLDMLMPSPQGFQTLAQIGNAPGGANVPVIIYSANLKHKHCCDWPVQVVVVVDKLKTCVLEFRKLLRDQLAHGVRA
jgi:CheY-like chemotaxis protein